jgi:hypothetical protein
MRLAEKTNDKYIGYLSLNCMLKKSNPIAKSIRTCEITKLVSNSNLY